MEGVVTRIFVKPGDRVRVGTPLVQINADKQQAAVRSTEASQSFFIFLSGVVNLTRVSLSEYKG